MHDKTLKILTNLVKRRRTSDDGKKVKRFCTRTRLIIRGEINIHDFF